VRRSESSRSADRVDCAEERDTRIRWRHAAVIDRRTACEAGLPIATFLPASRFDESPPLLLRRSIFFVTSVPLTGSQRLTSWYRPLPEMPPGRHVHRTRRPLPRECPLYLLCIGS